MKKSFFIFVEILLCCTVFAQNLGGKRIAVYEPTFVVDEGEAEQLNWIPDFVQGQVTAYFQNHLKDSGVIILDRQNISSAMNELKLSQSAAYSEKSQLEIGKRLSANYIVKIDIEKRGMFYSIAARITQLEVEGGTIVGKIFNNQNCATEKLEDGSVIAELSYTLLQGLGVSESKLADLKTGVKANEIAANINLAKGIASEKYNGSIVESLAYYQKAVSEYPGLNEAVNRMQTLTTGLANGNIREKVLKEIALSNEWRKIWSDYKNLLEKNFCYDVVYGDFEIGKKDFAKGIQEIKVNVAVGWNDVDLLAVYNRLYDAYIAIPKTSDWKIETSFNSFFPKKYYKSCDIYFSLVNENGEFLGDNSCSFYINRGRKKEIDYDSKEISILMDMSQNYQTFSLSIAPDFIVSDFEINSRQVVSQSDVIKKVLASEEKYHRVWEKRSEGWFDSKYYPESWWFEERKVFYNGEYNFVKIENALENDGGGEYEHFLSLGNKLISDKKDFEDIVFVKIDDYNLDVSSFWKKYNEKNGYTKKQKLTSKGKQKLQELASLFEDRIAEQTIGILIQDKKISDYFYIPGLNFTENSIFYIAEAVYDWFKVPGDWELEWNNAHGNYAFTKNGIKKRSAMQAAQNKVKKAAKESDDIW